MNQKKNIKNPDDRPILSKGKYDMNFIDWDNEWNQVYNHGFQNNNIEQLGRALIIDKKAQSLECLLKYLSKQWQNIEQEFERFEFQQEVSLADEKRLDGELVKQIPKLKMGKSSKDCTICCLVFQKGEIILKLPCTHIFHEQCLLPWLNKDNRCPNCRMDLKQYFTQCNKKLQQK